MRQISRHIALLIISMGILLGGCNTPPSDNMPLPDATHILQTAVDNVRAVSSFQMLIEQQGVPYIFSITLGERGDVNGELIRAEAQYIQPNVMYASARIRVLTLPVGFELFARGVTQWLKILGSSWQEFTIADGFNAGDLVKQGSGFDKALSNLREIQYMGRETLIDGSVADHVRGLADGQVVYDLLFGLLELNTDNVTLDVYISLDSHLPLQLDVTLPGTATDANPQDTQWHIELYNFDAAPLFDAPDGQPLGGQA